MAVLVTIGTGCSSAGSGPGGECSRALDCGPTGDAVCVAGDCLVYDESSGYGGAIVDLSFGRDMHKIAQSGYVWIIMSELASGEPLTCDDILAGADLRAESVNPLQVNPKYLRFNWGDSGGTFFPNNLIQFIRPASDVLAAAEAYQLLNGEGDLTAIGCKGSVNIVKDTNAEFVIPLARPGW